MLVTMEPNFEKVRDSRRPWGITLDSLRGDDLHFVDAEYDDRPDKTIDLRELLGPHREKLELYYGDHVFKSQEQLESTARRIPINVWKKLLDFDGLAKMKFGGVVSSTIHDYFDRMRWEEKERDRYGNEIDKGEIPEPVEFVYKLCNSLFHYGGYPRSWNTLVRAYYAIPDFEFGPGFEVRFDHSRYFNWWGRAFHVEDQIRKMNLPWEEKNKYWTNNELYLDGVFGYLIYYRGRHVMTLGFNLGRDRILLCQVQVRNQRGNRWLYKLPAHYFDYAVTQIADHFARYDLDTYLVDGEALAKRIESVHTDDNPMDMEAYDRIIDTYSMPLTHFMRGSDFGRKKMNYYKLIPYPNTMRHNPWWYR